MKIFKNQNIFFRNLGLILIFLFLTACNNKEISLRINDEIINVEIVTDTLSQNRGLSDRKSLCENCGMIFLFPKSEKHIFWMKDMNFPLDIIYIQENEIVEIFKNVSIFDEAGEITEIFPEQKADKVLEVNAGWCEAHNVQVGDKIEL
jgi:uncharacterized protein